jgi:hypothetical protein
MQVVSEPHAFLSNQQLLFGAVVAARDCYRVTSVNQPGDAVVYQVRLRGRKAPAKRRSSAARKTHGASTGLALGLISGFGTNLTRSRISPRSVVEGRPEATGRRQERRE